MCGGGGARERATERQTDRRTDRYKRQETDRARETVCLRLRTLTCLYYCWLGMCKLELELNLSKDYLRVPVTGSQWSSTYPGTRVLEYCSGPRASLTRFGGCAYSRDLAIDSSTVLRPANKVAVKNRGALFHFRSEPRSSHRGHQAPRRPSPDPPHPLPLDPGKPRRRHSRAICVDEAKAPGVRTTGASDAACRTRKAVLLESCLVH